MASDAVTNDALTNDAVTNDALTNDAVTNDALTIGTKFGVPDEAVTVDAHRLNRHTFWCGQSGSGKTYALGVLLEQVLAHTGLPLLILDPNADYVHLGRPVDGSAETARGLHAADVRVLHSTGPDGPRLHTRFLDLSVPAKAAVLQLDPIADADEYNVLLNTRGQVADGEAAFIESLRTSDDPGRRRLATRIENLEILDWDLWARGQQSVTDVMDERPDALVLDLGGFTHADEPKAAALAVFEHLWAKREERQPVLIVIDESHNLCPPHPSTLLERALVDRMMQIAAEGRKFGLWMLLATQRPTKIHPNVLSQCDNLGLMRMSSPRDLVELSEVFGYAPTELVQRSPQFVQGQALFAGGFVREPTLVQMGERLTPEGGADVKVPLVRG